MASTPNSISASAQQRGARSTPGASFIARLLAPLPEGEEPVDTEAFRKLIAKDMMQAWRAGMTAVERAVAAHTVTAHDAMNNATPGTYGAMEQANILAYRERVRAERAQCLIPAPTPAQLRWKKRVTKPHKIPQEVADAIRADEARLGGN